MRDVAVVGATMLKFGRYPDKDVVTLASEAAIGALKDAGCSVKDGEIVVSGNLYQSNAMIGQRIMKEIGATGVPVINVANACATGSTAFREAWMSVASGAYDVAMAIGSEQMGTMGLLGADGASREYSTEGVMGTGLMPGVFGQAGVEHMRKYGTTQEQFAKVAVKNHEHGVHNPYAQYQKETPLEEVLTARPIAWPNTLYMCCPTGDGAAAAVLMSADKAKQYTTKPVWVAASVLTSDPYSERNPTMFDINTVTRIAAKQAYVGGKIPVNASGGLLSKGHPLGATGVANIVEIVWHLRGEAGERQVEGSKVGLAHVIGLGSACTINILKK